MIEERTVLVECNHCGADHEVLTQIHVNMWNEPDLFWKHIGKCDECGNVVDVEHTRKQIHKSHVLLESELIKLWQMER